MLSKLRRLNHLNFINAKKTGQVYKSRFLSLTASPSNCSRFAVVTSSKLSKNAVTRNHLRRQIYSAVASFSKPYDIIIYPYPQILTQSYASINSEINSLLSKLS